MRACRCFLFRLFWLILRFICVFDFSNWDILCFHLFVLFIFVEAFYLFSFLFNWTKCVFCFRFRIRCDFQFNLSLFRISFCFSWSVSFFSICLCLYISFVFHCIFFIFLYGFVLFFHFKKSGAQKPRAERAVQRRYFWFGGAPRSI